ncbi:GTPase [Yinghuangia soli]|uniref:50S ribosome-binding GTPase n=1 Tax=Yinghuangia soli TaxID=2908204 RepID=A0AA41Q670_9ACTN|nr:GTPase [Yinghuangia soli]MCF2531710.1 50S ribosome-binding GTPase [Yinghuangia soli]
MNALAERFTGPFPGHDYGTEEEPSRLLARLSALERMADAADGRLPAEQLARARALLDRADARLRTAPQHAVVALAGATGSGKSSLFNELVGLGLSQTGARRPTTVTAISCAWDPDGARPLLDLLGLPRARQIPRHGALDSTGPLQDPVLSRLVLVDLPDHDSVETGHRDEVDRFVAAADHLIWVLDPQKYADALVHERYLRPLARHGDVMTVVLNQIDRLPEGTADTCRADLRRLLAADGLPDVRVVTTSAVTGEGVRELRDIVTAVAAGRRAAVLRLSADLDLLAEGFDPEFTGVVPGAEPVSASVRAGLLHGLGAAAGIGTVAAAAAREAGAVPQPVPVQAHQVDLTVRHAAAELTRGLPEPWAEGVRRVLGRGARRVPAALEVEMAAGPVGCLGMPGRVLGAAAAMWAGIVLACLGIVGVALALADVEPVGRWNGWYAALLPLVLGILLAVGAMYLGQQWRAEAERDRRDDAERQLAERVAEVVDEYLVEPATVELERYREAHALFVAAREPLHVR